MPLKGVSSTLLGSTMTIFTSSGFVRINNDVTIELMQDDSQLPLVEVDGMIQDMEEVELEKYLVQKNFPDYSASFVTGGVEVFRGEINRGEKVVDWEIDSNEIDQDSIQRKIEDIVKRLTELRTGKEGGWKESQSIFLEILRELRMKRGHVE